MARRRRAMTWVLALVAVVVGVPLLAALAGLLLPRDHVAQMTLTVAAPPDRVWSLVSDLTGSGRWRPEVREIQSQPSAGGRARYLEVTRQGRTPFEVVAQESPTRQVVRVVDDGLPFGGTWTWELAPSGTGTRLAITEAGFIRNPIFRVMSRLVFKPTATMDAYLRALARELGESAAPSVTRER